MLTTNPGHAELLLYKRDYRGLLQADPPIADLTLVDYGASGMPNIPLSEIASPFDVYKFATKQLLKRKIGVGDLILLSLKKRKVTEVFMLVLPDSFPEKVNRFFRMQRDDSSVDEYPMYLFRLGEHLGFNHG